MASICNRTQAYTTHFPFTVSSFTFSVANLNQILHYFQIELYRPVMSGAIGREITVGRIKDVNETSLPCLSIDNNLCTPIFKNPRTYNSEDN